MTQEQFDRSIARGEVLLTGFWQKEAHYGAPFFLLFLSAISIVTSGYYYSDENSTAFLKIILWVNIVLLSLSYLIYRIQKYRLKFQVVDTTLNHAQIKKVIELVADQLEWKGQFTGNDIYEAKTDPGFFSGSWGEQITILIACNKVFVNSICDLDKRSSIVSFGRNAKNEDVLIESINRAGKSV